MTRKKGRREMKVAVGLAAVGSRAAGSGLTLHAKVRHKLVLLNAAPGTSETNTTAERLQSALPTFAEELDRIVAWAKAHLLAKNLPDRPGTIIADADNSWHWPAAKEIESVLGKRLPGRVESAFAFAMGEEETQAWFAVRILEEANYLRQAKAATSENGMLQASFKLGRLGERRWWKEKHERAAEIGHKTQADRRTGQRAATKANQELAAIKHAEIIKAAKQIWADKKTLRGKYTETAQELLTTAGTNSVIIKYSKQSIRKILSAADRAGHLLK